jgi:asparagine N-glycosylation enzyme membrane subunit Stt3
MSLKVLPTDHFIAMAVYALLVSAFFALLWRDEKRERLRLFGILLAALLVGGLAVAWLMYPFPR